MDFILCIFLLLATLSIEFCSAKEITVTVGGDVTFPCASVASYPVWVGPELQNNNYMQYNNPGNREFANPNLPEQKKARLEWGSDNKGLVIKDVKVTDEGLYQCSGLTNLHVRVPPKPPVILNAENSTQTSLTVKATESQTASLVCVSTDGYPEQMVEWYRENTETSPLASDSKTDVGSYSYNVTKTYTFTPERKDDGFTYICQSSFQTEPRHISAVSVKLVLNLKPTGIILQPISAVSAGSIVEVRCASTGSRPAANISWSYQGEILPGEATTATLNVSTITYTVESLFRKRVRAEDNGKRVQCIVTHISMVKPPQLTITKPLDVHYPPDVIATTTNTTVKAESAVILCTANGNPDKPYRYGKWVHTWPGINTILSEKPGSEKLELTNLTYEHSGIYTCSASNGVREFGTDKEFIDGSVQLLVKSFPVITNPPVRLVNATAALHGTATLTVVYFSNVDESDVECFKVINDERQNENVCSSVGRGVTVNLPVFGHIVRSDGKQATISLGIDSQKKFGLYEVVISNEIGSTSLRLNIVPIEPPGVPYDLKIEQIQHTAVRFSWKSGSDSSESQTFVVQMSVDEIQWVNKTSVEFDNEEDKEKITTEIQSIQESMKYFIRMYAYNKGGNSLYSKSLNFTTLSKDKDKDSGDTNENSALIVGAVLGIVIIVITVYAVYVTIMLKRKVGGKEKSGTLQGKDVIDQSSSKMYLNMGLLTEERLSGKRTEGDGDNILPNREEPEDQYTGLDKQLRASESAYDIISSM